MDIFTTQLIRVVPVPIKPASLKVKALLKEAAIGALKEDHDHLENHDYYFISPKNEPSEQNKGNAKQTAKEPTADKQKKVIKNTDEQSVLVEGKDHKPHLDIFV